MGKGFFITGTDTNAGKTVLSALLCAALPGRYWKPIQTGAREDSDRRQVQSWAGLESDHLLPEAYLFDDPVSPHLAAQREGREIALAHIVLPAEHSTLPLIAEGAGGVMAPVNSREFMIDLMRHLALPVVLAARSTLGTINHTLLSVQCLRNAGLPIIGVVMIGPPDCDNRKAIEHYGKVQVIGQIPMLATINRQSLRDSYDRYFMKEIFQ
jgi:dethiobiotin synthetase/malonyl-CoA O-methyltransferase